MQGKFPTVPQKEGSSTASSMFSTGESVISMIRLSIPEKRWPTQVPQPIWVMVAVSSSTVLELMDAIGKASVAPEFCPSDVGRR